jgi:hypothetical protein
MNNDFEDWTHARPLTMPPRRRRVSPLVFFFLVLAVSGFLWYGIYSVWSAYRTVFGE